jgi:DNA-binding MarR family transcriptional regulator
MRALRKLHEANIVAGEKHMSVLPEEAALDILETVPMVMRVLRAEMRQHRQTGLSVPQFRSLAFLKGRPGAALNSLAEHIGLTPASTSKLVDGLVERNLVERRDALEDRRRIMLSLTPQGLSVWEDAFEHTRAFLAERLAGLSETEREALQGSMRVLRPLFEEGA